MTENNVTFTVPPPVFDPPPSRQDEAAQFRDSLGFHPANTPRIQLAHEAARLLAALMGTHLVHLLPNGREKSLAKKALEDVMMRSNRAIALGNGPHPEVDEQRLTDLVASTKRILVKLGAELSEDPRVEAYKAEQRGEEPDEAPGLEYTGSYGDQALAPFEYRTGTEAEMVRELEIGLTGTGGGEPEVKFEVVNHDEGENVTDSAVMWIDDPEVLDEIASYVLTSASRLRALKARRA